MASKSPVGSIRPQFRGRVSVGDKLSLMNLKTMELGELNEEVNVE